MTRDYIRTVAQLSILKDVAKSYPGRTIENIISNLESIKKYIEEHEETRPQGDNVIDLNKFYDLENEHNKSEQ